MRSIFQSAHDLEQTSPAFLLLLLLRLLRNYQASRLAPPLVFQIEIRGANAMSQPIPIKLVFHFLKVLILHLFQ